MSDKRYWFPVKAPGNGWGWGLPHVWEGWLVLAVFFAGLAGGMHVLAPYGPLATVGFACLMSVLLLAVCWWKGEPQGGRDAR